MNMSVSSRFSMIVSLVVIALVSAPAWAGGRPDSRSRDWFGQFGGGWSFAEGDMAKVADDDWTITGGALYWPSDWKVGISLEAAYANFDFSGAAIQAINDAIDSDPGNSGSVNDGSMESWQFGLNGIWSIGETSEGLYLTGGVGLYHVSSQLTQDGLAYYPPICSPWMYWCIPGGVGPGTFIVGSRSSDEFGWNVGLGYSFDTISGQFYIEARYVEIQTSPKYSTYIPVTFGFRW